MYKHVCLKPNTIVLIPRIHKTHSIAKLHTYVHTYTHMCWCVIIYKHRYKINLPWFEAKDITIIKEVRSSMVGQIPQAKFCRNKRLIYNYVWIYINTSVNIYVHIYTLLECSTSSYIICLLPEKCLISTTGWT